MATAEAQWKAEVSVEREGRRHVLVIGFATEQEDGTLAVTMSAVPVGNTLVLRPREGDLRKAERACYEMLRGAMSKGFGREVTPAEVLKYLAYGEMQLPMEDLAEAFSYTALDEKETEGEAEPMRQGAQQHLAAEAFDALGDEEEAE